MVYNFDTNRNIAKTDGIVLAKMKEGIAKYHGIQAVRDMEAKSSDSFKKVVKNPEDDGKISFKEKIINFGKGIIKPIKTMFSSPKNIAITAVSALAAAGIIAATGGAAAPVMVAAGLIGGAVQIGKGIYRQIKAKTDDEARNAWQDIGSGTFSVGVSALGAKGALKAAKVSNVKDMSFGSAILKCIKDLPSNLVKSFKTASFKISSIFGKTKPPVVLEIKALPPHVESSEMKLLPAPESTVKTPKIKSLIDSFIKSKKNSKPNYIPDSVKNTINSKYKINPEVVEQTASAEIKALPPHIETAPVNSPKTLNNRLLPLEHDVIQLPEHIESFEFKPVKQETPYGFDIIKSFMKQKFSNPKVGQSKPIALPPASESIKPKIGLFQKFLNFFNRYGLFLKD